MEMNATEKFYLPVDGISEKFNSCTRHYQIRTAHPLLQNTTSAPIPPNPSNKVSDISTVGMGIIKTVVAGSPRTGNRHSSSDRLPKRSVGLTKARNCRRIVVLGAPRVGKTNIVQRFLGGEFKEHYEPTSEDFHRKLYHIAGEAYQVDLLDPAKERDFPAKRRLSILTGDIFLLVFSVDDRDSFRKMCELRDEIKAAKTKRMKLKDSARVPVMICGNKVDVDPQRVVISRSEAREILGEDAAALFQTSAKDGTGLEGMFRALAALGGLPVETSPAQHQVISILSYQALMCIGRQGRRRRGGSRDAPGLRAPCAAVDPLARRPSFTSDLRLVIVGSSTKRRKPEKCQIQ
ncbi:GTP-binding protein Rhes [Diretmus argenteus]